MHIQPRSRLVLGETSRLLLFLLLVGCDASLFASDRRTESLGPQLWSVRVTRPWGAEHYELCTPTLDDCTTLPGATEVRIACDEPLLIVTEDPDADRVLEELLYDPRSHALLSRARIDASREGVPPTWLCTHDWVFSAYGDHIRARRVTSEVPVLAERSLVLGRVAFDTVDGVVRAIGPFKVGTFDETLGRFEVVTPPQARATPFAGGIVWIRGAELWVSDPIGRGARRIATPGPGELRVRSFETHVAVIWHAEVVEDGGTEMATVDDLSTPLGGGSALYLVDLATHDVVAAARWPTARTAVFAECTGGSPACRGLLVSWADRGRRPATLDLQPPAIRWLDVLD